MPKPRRRSEVESFGCPHRYRLIYQEGVDDSGDESVRGRAFHAVSLVYVLRLAAKQVPSDFDEARLAFPEGIAVTGCPHDLIPEVDRLFFRWAEGFELDVDAFLAAEEIERQDDRVFRPDLVYCRPAELEVVDWKTFYRGLTEDQAAKELQLRWYLVQAMKTWPGFSSYRFTYEFVRLNYRVSLAFSPEEVEAFEPGVAGAIAAMDKAKADAIDADNVADAYPAIPGSHCRLCRVTCPLVDNPHRLTGRVKDRAEAESIFGSILAKEQELRALKKALSGWCEAEGPLVLNGQEGGHHDTRSRSYQADDLIAWLQGQGISTGHLRISHRNLGDIGKPAKMQPKVTAYLADHEQTKQTWRFGHRKHGEIEGGEDDGD